MVWLHQGAKSAAEVAKQRAAAREAALVEGKVARLCSLLGPVISDTKDNIEKKQARTFEEMQAELDEAEAVRAHRVSWLRFSPPLGCSRDEQGALVWYAC